uniref:Uncharacterized protein n=1 Tax=viral metagenome TaxID=1070528 RepID=A0A6C0JWE5_9ZZZZ
MYRKNRRNNEMPKWLVRETMKRRKQEEEEEKAAEEKARIAMNDTNFPALVAPRATRGWVGESHAAIVAKTVLEERPPPIHIVVPPPMRDMLEYPDQCTTPPMEGPPLEDFPEDFSEEAPTEAPTEAPKEDDGWTTVDTSKKKEDRKIRKKIQKEKLLQTLIENPDLEESPSEEDETDETCWGPDAHETCWDERP